MADLEEAVYNVPPSPRHEYIDDLPPMDRVRAAPPTLMPKKGNSFRVSSVDLDRRAPTNMPRPAPRNMSLRKSSVDSLSDELKEDSAKLERYSSLDLGGINDADNSDVFTAKPLPQARARGSPNPIPKDTLLLLVDKIPTNRPKPRPRTRIQTKLQETNIFPAETQQNDQLTFPSPGSSENFPGRKEKDEDSLESKKHPEGPQVSVSSMLYFIPPDADSLEMLFDKEVKDVYGFSDISDKPLEYTLAKSSGDPLPFEQKGPFMDENINGGDYCNVQSLGKEIEKDLSSDASKSAINSKSVETPRTGVFGLETGSLCGNISEQSPFSSSPNQLFPTISSTIGKTTEATNLSFFDLSDLDPLWEGKLDNLNKNQTTAENVPEKINSYRFKQTTADIKTPALSSAVSATSNSFGTGQASHPQFTQPPKPHFVAKPVETQLALETLGWDEPLAPPPPLPNVVKLARPPPVPPRPINSPILAPQRPQILDMVSDGNQNMSSEDTTNIFDALPTPIFSPTSSTKDPFAGSGFDEDCYDYNTKAVVSVTQPSTAADTTSPSLPTPPSPSTKPKERAMDEIASISKAGRDPSEDPDRISRFVLPPPGAHISGSSCDGGYALARVKRKNRGKDDDSDSDSVDGMVPTFRQNSVDDMPASIDPRRSLTAGGEPQSPKKNIREGLLNKQGGFNANKGWRKRWVVFDGSKLSYYDSNKSQVSKRIIPVSCIKNVEIDVKADSYRFKVFTSLKNRVFVFSAEKRDDCTMWANVLMAAVVAHKSSAKPEETDMETRPDKEGFIRFANTKEYYVTITGQMLRYYQSLDDYQEGSPVHEIDMKLASVKANESKKLRLQLWVHYGHFDLIFPSEQELQQWRLAMEVAIAEGLADDTVLNKVYENLSNQQCADCGAPNPHWASINLGIVVCKNCAGIHRMFDYRITRIKSLRMDTRIWTPSLIELMVTLGNANANMFWAAKLPSEEKIESSEMIDRRRDFITKKYVEKRFADRHPLLNLKPALGEELLKAARNDNVLDTMRILLSGADVMYRQNNDGPTAFEIVKEGRQRLVMEFLFQNGGDPQSLEEDVQDENRLREDVRLQGFLNKTGPMGKTFERRWCVIEHGALTYYVNEKTSMIKGSVDRKDMLMISSVDTDRIGYQFELSTTLRDNRTFTFSSDIKDDAAEWIGTIAKLMAPVAVMEHVGMIDIKFAGYAFMKGSVNEWHQTFLVFSWRVLNFMNKDLKFDYLDLRKASSIRMQDASMGYQNRGPCFVISSTKWTVYIQANLQRDTEKMYSCLLEAITGSGSTLNDQVLTPSNVPVIVDRCITHIEVHGLKEKGIYRTAGQSSRVQALLDEFRRDVLSVSLSEYPVVEVADTLKRFLRELDDSVFERINYPAWLSAAGCTELSNRLSSYEYYLKKMPNVHFSTLKRIILHLHQVAEHSAVNKMPIANLASCFAPSLMRTNKDKIHLPGNAYSQEIKIIIDLMENKDFFFHADEGERIIASHIDQAKREMDKLRESVHPGKFESWLVPCQILDKDVSVNVEVTDTRTAAEAMEKLNEVLSRSQPQLAHLGKYVLYETLFKGDLVRPIFPNDIVATTTKRWIDFDAFVNDDITMSLHLRDMTLLDALDTNYQHQSHSLQAELQYSDSKSKKFKTKTVRFKQCQLAIYNKARDSEAAYSWKVEDLSFYLGAWPKRNSASRHCLTFLVNGEKYTKAFGHCLGFHSEEDLHQWAAMLYAVQNPDGLLSWQSAFPYDTAR